MSAPARGRLLAYSRYQVGDFLLQRASLPLVLILLIAVPQVYLMRRDMSGGAFRDARSAGFAHQFFSGGSAFFLYLAAFLGGVAIAPLDRQPGHYRFYFSKPVSVRAYYAQAYLVNGLTLVALYALMTVVYGTFTAHQSLPRGIAAAALLFVLIGGLGFLLSALTNWDSLAVALLLVVAVTLQQLVTVTPNPLPRWATALARVLPPVVTLDELRERLFAGYSLGTASLRHVLGYGLGAFAAGFLLYRRVPLAR